MNCNTDTARWFLYSLPAPLWMSCDDKELHALVRLLPAEAPFINGLIEGAREIADHLMEPESAKMPGWLPMCRQLGRLRFWLNLRLAQVDAAAEGNSMDLTVFEGFQNEPVNRILQTLFGADEDGDLDSEEATSTEPILA